MNQRLDALAVYHTIVEGDEDVGKLGWTGNRGELSEILGYFLDAVSSVWSDFTNLLNLNG